METSKLNMNFLLLRSIPIDKHMKMYFISKYRHLVHHNGLTYANAKFKHILCSMKEYKAQGSKPGLGVRNNGWVKKLYMYMDSQPHFVLTFLKGLTSWKGELNVEESQDDFHQKLENIVRCSPIPHILTEWYNLILAVPLPDLKEYHQNAITSTTHAFHLYCKHHSVHELHVYVIKWRKVLGFNRWLKPTDRKFTSLSRSRPVFPEMYKDYDVNSSASFERDYANVISMLRWNPDLSWENKMTIMEVLSDDVRDEYFAIKAGEYSPIFDDCDVDEGLYMGDIHYIPKNGTDYRPIGVPNRFVQSALEPLYTCLKQRVRKLPHDCTFRQEMFDNVIQSRVTTDSRFIGSVDLSSATENLPLTWISPLIDAVVHTDDEKLSWDLFQQVSRGVWQNGSHLSSWKVGQPLGTLPSFMVLTLTHNLVCEALSLSKGYEHSPYRVLGDDIVIFSKKLYRAYIRCMEDRNIPLSLHKSYHGKLTEFAGKVFIKKNKPFLLPDHNILTWESLFDYQYATGVRVPWNLLPKAIKNKITKIAKRDSMSGQSLYTSTQACLVYDRGTSNTEIRGTLLEKFFEFLPDRAEEHESVKSIGVVKLDNMVIQINKTSREIGGMYRRYYQVKLPDYLRSKYRPVATDSAFSTTIRAVKELKREVIHA